MKTEESMEESSGGEENGFPAGHSELDWDEIYGKNQNIPLYFAI